MGWAKDPAARKRQEARLKAGRDAMKAKRQTAAAERAKPPADRPPAKRVRSAKPATAKPPAIKPRPAKPKPAAAAAPTKREPGFLAGLFDDFLG